MTNEIAKEMAIRLEGEFNYHNYLFNEKFTGELANCLRKMGLPLENTSEVNQQVREALGQEVVNAETKKGKAKLETAMAAAKEGQIETVGAILEERPVTREALTVKAIAQLQKASKIKARNMIFQYFEDEPFLGIITDTIIKYDSKTIVDYEQAAAVYFAKAIFMGTGGKWNPPQLPPTTAPEK